MSEEKKTINDLYETVKKLKGLGELFARGSDVGLELTNEAMLGISYLLRDIAGEIIECAGDYNLGV